MSSSIPKRLVLNSHRFFRDITPEVFNALPTDEETIVLPAQGDPGLYAAIRDGNHKVILTQGIQAQYFSEVGREGYTENLLLQVIEYLEDEGLIIRPRLPGGRRNISGIPQRHRAFFTDAILSNAQYFVTENPVWLRLADLMLRNHQMRIVTPGGFIQREGL